MRKPVVIGQEMSVVRGKLLFMYGESSGNLGSANFFSMQFVCNVRIMWKGVSNCCEGNHLQCGEIPFVRGLVKAL